MPLVRRIPKRGFTHKPANPVEVINVGALNRFPAGSEVNPSLLAEAGLLRSKSALLKILGDRSLDRPLTVKAHRFSKSALEKIAAAGGTAEIIGC